MVEVPILSNQSVTSTKRDNEGTTCGDLTKHVEEIMNLQLELDILKIILQEERSNHAETEETAKSLSRELQLSKEMVTSVTKYEQVQEELKNLKLVIEALESQQIQSINEMEDLRNSNICFEELLKEKELEISHLKEQARSQEFKDLSLHSESEDSPLEAKLKKMHESLEKAKRLNDWYQNDLAFQASHEQEVEEVRKQVEAETAEVIVCLQEELSVLQQEVHDSKMKEMETTDRLAILQTQMKILEDNLHLRSEDNSKLSEMLEDKEKRLKTLTEEWDLIGNEIEGILSGGHEALNEASDQIDVISSSIPHKQSCISEQFGRMKTHILEKELYVQELNRCLKDAMGRRDDMECMLRSLRGAALVMTETHQQECVEKDKEILFLTSELNKKTSTVAELQNLMKHGERQLEMTSSCATAALVIVNRLWELNSKHQNGLNDKDVQLREFQEIITQKDKTNEEGHSLLMKLEGSEAYCTKLRLQLAEEQKHREALEVKIEEDKETELFESREKLEELNSGVSALKLSISELISSSANGECESRVCS